MNQGDKPGEAWLHIGDIKKNVETWNITVYNRYSDCREVKA